MPNNFVARVLSAIWSVVLMATLALPLGCNKAPSQKAAFTTVGSKIGAGDAGGAEAADRAPVGFEKGDAKKAADGKGDLFKDGAGEILAKKAADAELKGAAAKKRQQPRPPAAGQLTAGSFDDAANWNIFTSFLTKFSQGSNTGDMIGRFQGRHLVLTVTNEAGAPIHNARVQVARDDGQAIELLSRTDGRAVIVTPWDDLATDVEWTVTVTHPDGGQPVTHKIAREVYEQKISLGKVDAFLPDSLDLALVIDTTGSMGDELNYLKSEMKWIAETVKKRFPQVQQRYALILYRDLNDEYVTRTFGFTDSLDELRKNMQGQSATGGGDYPEAVHKAMEDANKLQWRGGRTARILIHVADAPPQNHNFQQTFKHVDKLRKSGVAIYPIACSGYDPACEFLMRTSAVLTGSQFLFLTDDSGIGNSHAEPNINAYHVEHLNTLMVRMISSELSGQRLDPQPEDILRTVGEPQRAVEK